MKCCELMAMALAYAAQRETRPPGLGMQQLFNINTGQPTRAFLLYRLPGYGRGKERVEAETFVVKCCPFCGKETGVAADLAAYAGPKKPNTSPPA